MLQEWLEELAEDEMKKTASSQLEEGLNALSVNELKGFLNLNKEATQFQLAAPEGNIDPVLGRQRGRAVGAALGGLGGAGIGGGVGGAPGALVGAALGAGGGYLLGGRRGAAVAQGRQDELREKARIMDEIQMERMRANMGAMDQLKAERAAQKAPPGPAGPPAALPPGTEEALAKGASDKFAMAANAGRNLAHIMSKQAQAPMDPFAPRVIQADPINREQYIQQSMDQGRTGGKVLGGMTGAALGGLGGAALGGRIGNTPGAAIGGALGAIGGAYGLGRAGGRAGQSLGRASSMKMSDEEMQAATDYDLADQLHGAGRISDEEMQLAEQRFFRPQLKGSLTPQVQQIPVMPGSKDVEKTSSFRDAIIKAAQKGAITNYEWEL